MHSRGKVINFNLVTTDDSFGDSAKKQELTQMTRALRFSDDSKFQDEEPQ